MSQEKKLILEMLKEGKINTSEAEQLLEGIITEPAEMTPVKTLNRKFLRVSIVEDNNTKVNINIPIALAEVGLKLVPKDQLKIGGKDFNMNEILSLIHDGSEGELMNIDTIDKGKHVQARIFID